MSRTVTAALQAELSKTISRIGYLLAFSTSPVIRICDLATVNWNGMVFVEYDFSVSGIGEGEGGPEPAVFTAQNLDSAMATAFMTADATQVAVDVYQVAPAALAVADVVKIGRYLLGDCEIGLDKATIQLIPESSIDAFSPRRRIDPANGFYYALPEGSKIAWENEIYIVGGANG